MKTPRILIIAGSDSGGGAGIQADIKTVTMLGGHAMTAVTAITAQNTLGVQAVMPVPAEMVLAQIDSVVSDIGVDAVKIGMIGSPEVANAVAERLVGLALATDRERRLPIVFDPVMVSTSGTVLADEATVAAFERLLRLATVVTPNSLELAALTGVPPIEDEAALLSAATMLAKRTAGAVLAKGGHVETSSSGEGETITDLLVRSNGTQERWMRQRLDTEHTHGTGCTLASALAISLAHGLAMHEAVGEALDYVYRAIVDAPGLGRGNGPLGHRLATDA
jgi:hydroxymethylpyrimidine/phosphomethylpyrimidine kinase